MSNAPAIVGVVGGLVYAAYAVPTMFQFLSYCEMVAAATGKTGENADKKTQDDGGLNAFQHEQYRLLRNGDFMNFPDAAVVAYGIVVARKLRVSFWAAVALVVSFAAADILTQ